MKRMMPLAAVALLAVSLGCPKEDPPDGPGWSCATSSVSGLVKVKEPIVGKYIVMQKQAPAQIQPLMQPAGVSQVQTISQRAYVARFTTQALQRVLVDSNTRYVQEEGLKRAPEPAIERVPAPNAVASWGLDRIDQRKLPLDGVYAPGGTHGTVVHSYTIDTGLDASHPEFEGRVGEGFSVFPGGPADGHGHGTHVTGTIAGMRFGVASRVIVHGVKVLDDNGSGSDSGVAQGIRWAVAHRKLNGWPGVANLSLGGGSSPVIDEAICEGMAEGMFFALAAGNEAEDARNSSPARVRESCTVGSSTRTDGLSSFSNFGPLLDIVAPGSDITSSVPGGGQDTWSGTSMATPHVAGVAALILERNPTLTPAALLLRVVEIATVGELKELRSDTVNALSYFKEE